MIYITITISVIITIIFALTVIDKILKWRIHISSIENYRLVPNAMHKPMLILMILSELFIVFSLIVIGAKIIVTIVFLTLLTVYTSAIGINVYRGNKNISCGCGNVLESEKLSYKLIIRNLLLMLMFAILALNNQYHISQLNLLEAITLVITAISFILITLILKEYIYSRKKLEKILKIFHMGVE